MKVLFDHIDRVKQQPHHIRRQVALTVAGGLAALIGLVWLLGSLSLGTFALKGSDFAASTNADQAAPDGSLDNAQLAGAAAATPSNSSAAHIEIIDSATTTKTAQPEQTVIPF